MLSLANKKTLKFIITLGDGSFGDYDKVTLEGYRASVNISLAGALQYGSCSAQIYGMKTSDMATITTYAPKVGVFKPTIFTIYAVDGDQESLAFTGNIITAWADYQGMPQTYLDIQSQAGYVDLMKAVPPKSFKGAIDVASTMQQIAYSMGYGFENNGVNVILDNVYLPNTGMAQAYKLAQDAGITIITDNNTIKISPIGKAFSYDKVILSAKTGMIGYPTFDGTTMMAKTLFNPAIVQGGTVTIQSEVARANGDWIVLSMDHSLESETPGGQWFTTIRGINTSLYGK